MGMNLAHGGHLTHGSPANFSGSYFHVVSYGVNDDGFIDYEQVRQITLENKPKLTLQVPAAMPAPLISRDSVRLPMKWVLI